MNGNGTQTTVIELARADAAAIADLRSALASAYLLPMPCILVDLTNLQEIDGPVLAALFIASKEIPADGRLAVLASEPVMDTIVSWSLDTFWECFTDQALAEEYLRTGDETMH